MHNASTANNVIPQRSVTAQAFRVAALSQSQLA